MTTNDTELSTNARKLLRTLQDLADPRTHQADPSVSHLANRHQISERYVRFALRELEQAGVITHTTPAGPGQPHTWTVSPPKLTGDELLNRLEAMGVAWLGHHPTVYDPERGGQRGRARLRRCVRCNAREGWYVGGCDPGLFVHLIAIGDDPQPARQHAYWADQGYVPTPRPEPAADHPVYRPCPRCNAALVVYAGQPS